MSTKVNNFLVRVLLRALLSLHLLESFRVQLDEILGYYRLFRHGDCGVSTSDLSNANLLQGYFERSRSSASVFSDFVKSNFDYIPNPCKLEVSFPDGVKPPVCVRCSGFCRISFPGLCSKTYDLLPGDLFSISFKE